MTERGGVTSIDLTFSLPHHIRWPSALHLFRHLIRLKIRVKYEHQHIPLYNANIEALAPTIEFFDFHFFNASACFYDGCEQGNPTPKDLKRLFPRLKRWDIPPVQPNPLLSNLSEIPSTLTILNIEKHGIPYESIILVPRSVVDLRIRLLDGIPSEVMKTFDPSFPPSLQKLRIAEVPSSTFIRFLPSTLEYLHVSGTEGTEPWEEQEMGFEFLPSTLKSFAFLTVLEPLWTPPIFRKLPRGLTSLDFVIEDFADELPHSEILECLQALPKQLKTLYTFPGTLVSQDPQMLKICAEEIKSLFATVNLTSHTYSLIWKALGWFPPNLFSISTAIPRRPLPDSITFLTMSVETSFGTDFRFPSSLKSLEVLRRPLSLSMSHIKSLQLCIHLKSLVNVSLPTHGFELLPSTLKELHITIVAKQERERGKIRHLTALEDLNISSKKPLVQDHWILTDFPKSLTSFSFLHDQTDAIVLKHFNPSTAPLLAILELTVQNLGDHHLTKLPPRLHSLLLSGGAGKDLTSKALLSLPSTLISIDIPSPLARPDRQMDFLGLPYLKDLRLMTERSGTPVTQFTRFAEVRASRYEKEFGSLHFPLQRNRY
jgi:hypothetical protein